MAPPPDDHETFSFSAELWMHDGPAAWFFVTVPGEISDVIDLLRPRTGPGFGSVRVHAQIGGTAWSTSVFPDTSRQAYVLPVKAAVRRSEAIDDGDVVAVTLTLAR